MLKMKRAEYILGSNYFLSSVAVAMVVYFTRTRPILYLIPAVLFLLGSSLLMRGWKEELRLKERKERGVSAPAEVIGISWKPLYNFFQMRGYLFFRLVLVYRDESGAVRQVESSHYGVLKRRKWTASDERGMPAGVDFEAKVSWDPRYPEEVSAEVVEKARED